MVNLHYKGIYLTYIYTLTLTVNINIKINNIKSFKTKEVTHPPKEKCFYGYYLFKSLVT